MTGQPYIYGAANPVTYSDPSGLCAGSEVFDYCITNDGNVLDQGTTRLAPATNVNGASPAAVADAINQLQVGQYDHSNPSDAGDIANDMFNRAISSGSVVPNPDGGYMLAGCDGAGWCRNYWHSPISELLLGIPSTALEQMVDVQLMVSVSMLTWPGGQAAVAGGLCSFSAETQVLMADGSTKPISEIRIGDRVIAFDPETGERGDRVVSRLWVHDDVLVDLHVGGGSIKTTEDHPFWNQTDGEWQQASNLDPGDFVLSSDGDLLGVGGIDWVSAQRSTAYNLTVRDIHTYFVVVGDEEVLVHNNNGLCGGTFAGAGIDTHAHFLQRLAQRASRGVTEGNALDAYRNGRLFYDPRHGNYVRYSSRNRLAVVVSEPSGGMAISVFPGSPSPSWVPIKWRAG